MKRLENKGITLVALVVTIIVLIILAGVSISLVLGQDGVVQKAKSGRDNYAEAARVENEQLANVDAFAMDIEAMIPSSPSDNQGNATGTITNMTGGDLEISATVSLSANTNFERTKYVFTTSSSSLGTTDETLYKDGAITQTNTTITKSKAAGTYYLHILATDTNGGKTEIISEQTATSQGKKNFDYTGDEQNITLTPGNYKLEVWGAQGGDSGNDYGGKGGYSVGNINIRNSINAYVYVGGKGKYSSYSLNTMDIGGYNGGGGLSAWTKDANNTNIGGGGGATDIRIDSTSLFARVIVAGGGGGGLYASATESLTASNTYGGYGGGISGESGKGNASYIGYGGTQISGGACASTSYSYNIASFGVGGTARNDNCSAGGSGWYGGGGTANDNSTGGGGSGWVFTESAYNTWKNGNATDANQYLLKDHPEYYLTNAQTIAGNTSFTAPGGSSETGHSGNGYARITALD